jgi:hypothetical protein
MTIRTITWSMSYSASARSRIAGRTTDATLVEDSVRPKSAALGPIPTRRTSVASITPSVHRLRPIRWPQMPSSARMGTIRAGETSAKRASFATCSTFARSSALSACVGAGRTAVGRKSPATAYSHLFPPAVLVQTMPLIPAQCRPVA